MNLADIDILTVWRSLGGGPLRGKRGQAFWRDGDGHNVSLDAAKGTWYDHRDGRGGGVLALAETAVGCSRADALLWLTANCGLNSRRSFSHEQRTERAIQGAEHREAASWGVAVNALAEKVLEQLDASDESRSDFTRLLEIVRKGGMTLSAEYRAWCETQPQLAHAMVRAGMSSRTRIERRLAFFLMEVARVA